MKVNMSRSRDSDSSLNAWKNHPKQWKVQNRGEKENSHRVEWVEMSARVICDKRIAAKVKGTV